MKIKLAVSVARAAFTALVTASVFVGCNDGQLGGPDGSGGTNGGVPLEMFASDFQAAFCAPRVACGAFPDLATCEAFETFADNYAIRNIIASASRGTVTYDPIAAADCIASLPQDCSIASGDEGAPPPGQAAAIDSFQAINPCIAAFTGTVPLGGACRFNDFECASPNFCLGMGACTGTCTAGSGNNLPTGGAPGDDCSQNGFCLLPAICNGTCVIPPGHLASCPSPGICGYLDDYCGLAPGATMPTCLPRIANGSRCTLGDANLGPTFDPCVLDSQCVSGVCVAAYSPLGGACGTCLSPMVCTTGTCATPAPLGDFCPIPM